MISRMIASVSNGNKGGHSVRRRFLFRVSAIVAGICVCFAIVILAVHAAQIELPRNALWEVVRNICVPGQTQYQDPKPCVHVDLKGGMQNGFAVLRDPRRDFHFLLIPTAQISGIESSVVREPNAPNYFALAWEARTYINQALHKTLPRDEVAMAINSSLSRTQDQFHIHVSCVSPEVLQALRKNEMKLGDQWAPFAVTLSGHQYAAMWVAGENMDLVNPFNLLAQRMPGAISSMAGRTLVVVGFTRSGGAKGFVILAGQAKDPKVDLANGEELLDHMCRVAR